MTTIKMIAGPWHTGMERSKTLWQDRLEST